VSFLHSILAGLGRLVGRERAEREMDEELRSYVQMAADDKVAEGMSREGALRAARLEMGSVETVKERVRQSGWESAVGSFWQDVRFGARMLRKSPGFTAVAVLTLALGIGANTAIFSLINTVMLRVLPVWEPEQLVEPLNKYPGEPRGNYFSLPSYEYYQQNNHVFSGIIAAHPTRFTVRGVDLDAELENGEFVSGNFFSVLGLKAEIGRLIGPEDDRSDAAGSAVAVVSWSYWRDRSNFDPAILGKQILINEVALTVIGVTPREFFGLQLGSRPSMWVPLAMEPTIQRPSRIGGGGLRLLARLKPGVSFDQARAEMAVLFRWTVEERTRNSNDPLMRQLRFEMEPASAGLSLLRDRLTNPLLLLMSIVSSLLLLACANIASMLLARAAARQREIAVRAALGASRFRVVRQMLIESLLLSSLGGLVGVFIAYFGAGAFLRMLASGRQIVGLPSRLDVQVQIDVHVLVFTVGITLLTGVLFGLAPAVHGMAAAPGSLLHSAGRTGEARFRRFFGKSLVAAQVALSVVLLGASGLFIGHLSNLRNIDLGFQRDHVLLVRLDPTSSGYNGSQLSQMYRELLARLEATPGVRSATVCGASPISGAGASGFLLVEGHQERPEDRRYTALNWIAPNYFATMGTPLLLGRDFSFEDQAGRRVAIVNEALANYYFSGVNPIGRQVKIAGEDQSYEIIGMAGDAKYYEIREVIPRTMYLNTFQRSRPASQFAIRTSIDPVAMIPNVRRTVRELLPAVPVANVMTLMDQINASIVLERVIATLSGLFGALAVLLAGIGLYGLLAYTVAQRKGEIGIRMALGAQRSIVLRAVVGEGMRLVLLGVGAGMAASLALTRFLSSLLYGVEPTDPTTFVAVTLLLLAVALLACYMPARRATKIEPMAALRHE
jgi:predicted permease